MPRSKVILDLLKSSFLSVINFKIHYFRKFEIWETLLSRIVTCCSCSDQKLSLPSNWNFIYFNQSHLCSSPHLPTFSDFYLLIFKVYKVNLLRVHIKARFVSLVSTVFKCKIVFQYVFLFYILFLFSHCLLLRFLSLFPGSKHQIYLIRYYSNNAIK